VNLTNKNILLISPEPWDHIFVSKHHYAIHLAKRGNKVFFLNPHGGKLRLAPTNIENVSVVHYPGFMKGLRFLPPAIQRVFMRMVLRKLEALADIEFNVIWSFDNSVWYDFTIFSGDIITISHIVDPSQNFRIAVSAKTASVCLCNTELLKSRLGQYNKRVFKINHGYNEVHQKRQASLPGVNAVKAIYSGNLDIPYLDWEVMYRLVKENSDVDFIFLGPGYERPGRSDSAILFKPLLASFANVYLIGKVASDLIPGYLESADILLICYQEQYHDDQASNPHKLMEYLGSGRVVVATFTKEFQLHRDIMVMANQNSELPVLFKEVINDLGSYNLRELSDKRIAVAKENTYDKQIDRIEKIIYG
jgi:hypothetical protein